MSKTTKIVTSVIISILAATILISGIVYAQTASAHNKAVDALAADINDNLSELTMDLTQDTIDQPTAFKYLIELSVLDSGTGVEEEALTYYDGSKNKYDEVTQNIDNTIDAYQSYFRNKNEGVLTQTAIDIAAANKDEINAAIEQLKQLIADIDTQSVSTRLTDAEWSIIFGDNQEEANNYLNDLKERATQKLSELQARLNELTSAEAQAQVQAQAQASSNSSSDSSATNNNSSSSSNNGAYSNSGSSSGGSSSGGSSWTTRDTRSAYERYQSYVEGCKQSGITPKSFEEWSKYL